MTTKDRGKIAGGSKKTDAKMLTDYNYKYTVSEGSTVTFDLSEFINIKEIHNINSNSFSCRQTSGIPVENLGKDNYQTFSFKAPYIRSNDVNIRLNFELAAKDNDDNSATNHVTVIVKRVQRAMIFQGGVALGAYEAGVFSALVESKEDELKRSRIGLEKRPMFDIVAGASIGAMNGAIVVSSVTNEDKRWEEAQGWKDAAKELIEFWRGQEYLWPTIAEGLDMTPMYHFWLNILHNTSKVFKASAAELIELYLNMNGPFKKWYYGIIANWFLVDPNLLKDYFLDGWYIPATAEAARRYYSGKQIDTFGAFNVATGIPPWSAFAKFFDFTVQSNYLPRPDNKHFALASLKETLGRFAHFPIKTEQEDCQPRFLLVTVDAQTGDAVTFDSYSKEAKYHDDLNSISNKRGIEIEHALASGTFPGFFDYPKFKVDNSETGIKNEEHIFWDGGYRSNTPLREVIQAHRDYWHKTRRHNGEEQEGKEYKHEEEDVLENDVPDLEIYIADLWPSELKERPLSFDLDFVESRKRDLFLGDKTDYDEQVANVVTDYVDLAKQLENLAKRKGATKEEINYILDRYASSNNTIGKTRQYKELLLGRFRITKVVRIDRKDDGNEVGTNIFDYSRTTIEKLMQDGYRDASIKMGIESMKDEFFILNEKFVRLNEKKKNLNNNDNRNYIKKLEEELEQIQRSTKIENGQDATTIIEQVEDFIDKVKSMGDEFNDNTSLKEAKILVLAAANQFQETIKSLRNHNL